MSILVVGSVAYDDIITPFASRQRALGGSAIYFSLAAQHFTPISMVAVIGDDFKQSDMRLLESHRIDTTGLIRESGPCFYWKGEYLGNWNDRITHATHLNVFEHFNPVIPHDYRKAEIVFLGNIAPELQNKVLDQVEHPRIVALDTMNYWISHAKEALIETLRRVNILIVNDSEARLLSGEQSIIEAARTIRAMGPTILCIKRGEHGALLWYDDQVFVAPAYPMCEVVDPTGAGDSFAGGFLGYLARQKLDIHALRRAVVHGSVMGSFTVESFSVDRLAAIGTDDVNKRYQAFVDMTHFDR
ncbi:MAG: bifunctional hydroxymethylpyrimidine kinase/phosphomethylpyrimidine kinase [Acidobacteria bacterium]|nr:bifunctional hydroxymethylpyrimidine kinase/phosphomethylpyrimidine kinase [Acidobacteriota bacterium]